jgi:hypothetical protein
MMALQKTGIVEPLIDADVVPSVREPQPLLQN